MHAVESWKLKLVAIDDDPLTLDLIRDGFETKDLDIYTSTTAVDGMQLVKEKKPEIVVLDRVIPGVTGMELLEQIVEWNPMTNVILLTGYYTPESAVEAIKKGAVDYVTKPDFLDKLSNIIDGMIDEVDRTRRHLKAMDDLLENFEVEGIVGRSPLMLTVFERARRVAPHFRTVLITGETGTGKELMAKALHKISPVASKPFVIANTSALVETLLESELFGHVRGAFTGASNDKLGLFEYANGGTVFLDEIGEMSMSAQTRLLRVLQTQEIQRVGSPEVKKLNVRVIAATNRDLRAMVAEKKFRDDLYYRLAAVELELPSLAERKEDLPLLERYFLTRFAQEFGKPNLRGLTPRADILLRRYRWPGNIRELENVLSYACMVAERDLVDIHDLPDRMHTLKSEDMLEGKDLVPLEVMESRYTCHVVERLGGNRSKAASVLGVSRAKLYRILRTGQGMQSKGLPNNEDAMQEEVK